MVAKSLGGQVWDCPCPISDRKVRTVNELAALATEHLRSAECANGKLAAVAEIVGPV